MSTVLRIGFAGVLVCALLSGCASTSPSSSPQAAEEKPHHHLTEIQAIRLAVQGIERERSDPARYSEPEVTRDGAVWHVFFRGKQGIPGDHCLVLVNDVTGEVQVAHGA
jgi:hypothetical protein